MPGGVPDDDLDGQVPGFNGLGQRPALDLGKVGPGQAVKGRGLAPISRRGGLCRDGQPAGDGLQAASLAAAAQAALWLNAKVSDLQAGAGPAADDLALIDAAAANPRAGEHA